MTCRIFQYRLPMDGQPDELNAWLASHRVVSVAQHLAASPGGALTHSNACRKGRGQHAALRQAACWTRWADHFGKIDVWKFYDSIRYDILFRLLERRFRECRLLDLFAALLSSYRHLPGSGLPIGALTSQYLGNFMLDRLDQEMKHAGARRYLRYMYDVVIWGSPRELADSLNLSPRSP